MRPIQDHTKASHQAATAVFKPTAGTYTGTQSVTISDATPAAVIYYTNNGTTPTTASTKYTGKITVSATETIKAIATASGYTSSPVDSAPTPSRRLRPRLSSSPRQELTPARNRLPVLSNSPFLMQRPVQ